MTPQEKLEEIEYENKRHPELEEIYGYRNIDWLIARCKQLEEAFKKLQYRADVILSITDSNNIINTKYEMELLASGHTSHIMTLARYAEKALTQDPLEGK